MVAWPEGGHTRASRVRVPGNPVGDDAGNGSDADMIIMCNSKFAAVCGRAQATGAAGGKAGWERYGTSSFARFHSVIPDLRASRPDAQRLIPGSQQKGIKLIPFGWAMSRPKNLKKR